MPPVLKRSVSFLLLVAAIGLFVLQALPLPGIFIVMLGAPFIDALLLHLFLVALFVESAIGRLPRVLAVVPFLAYGAYYWAYFEQDRMVAEESAKLRTINIGKVFDFDPSAMSLVLDKYNDLDGFVAFHQIQVAYSGISSARLVPASQCATMKSYDNGAKAWVRRIPIYDYHLFTKETQPCWLTRIEQPPNRPVLVQSADHASPLHVWLGISEPSTDIVVDGKIVGSLREIYVRRIPPYLWFLGCGLVDSPASWACGGFYEGGEDYIRWYPPSVDRARFDTPASILLGIPKYTNSMVAGSQVIVAVAHVTFWHEA
jgi:hypothetical protein